MSSSSPTTISDWSEPVLLRPRPDAALSLSPVGRAPLRFHASMPGYEPTPLRPAPASAERLGVAEVLVKDESSRLGLPSFKVLGASWAVCRALAARAGRSADEVASFDALVECARELAPLSLSAATDGNHGRAVAHMAALLGLGGQIYVPAGTAQARIDAIAGEGAEVSVVDGGYEAAVRRSAEDEGERCLVISDTSWPGYEDVPRWVIEGYATIFDEIEGALAGRSEEPPDLVVVQVGVGALAAAAVRHFWSIERMRPMLIAAEPVSAACVLASVAGGGITTLEEPQVSIMAGLNCATPSLVAWPLVSGGIDAYVAVADGRVPEAMRLLARDGVVAGETGAAGLAALLRLLDPGEDGGAAPGVGLLDRDTRVLLLSTEGATDPEAYRRLTEEDQR